MNANLNEKVSIELSVVKRLLKKLVDEAIESGANASMHVRIKALEVEGLTEESDPRDIKDAIKCYIFALHQNMNYHDVIHQAGFDGFGLLKDFWQGLGHSFHNESML